MNYNKFLLALLLSTLFSVWGVHAFFSSLSSTSQYAQTLPEYVEAENNNWLDPDFSEFHKSSKPGIVGRVFGWLGAVSSAWDAQSFKAVLQRLTRQRGQRGYMGNFVLQYTPKKDDHFFIWTDLFGAFHSLVRDLTELQREKVVDEDFKIVKPNCWFVFNGNVIDHSPYSLETLSVILRLLEKNPDQVIYLRGDHESNQEWHSYSLARELKIRASGVSRSLIPLSNEITKFFNTLPIGLYLSTIKDDQIDLVLITNNKKMNKGLKESTFGSFFEQPAASKAFNLRKLSNKMPSSKKKIELKIIISGEDRSVSYRPTPGLFRGTTREGGTGARWIAFSAPTSRNRTLYEFFYDAFVRLSIPNGIDTWILTLFNQDVRLLQGFEKAAEYNLLTGQLISGKATQLTPAVGPIEEQPKQEEKRVADMAVTAVATRESESQEEENGVAKLTDVSQTAESGVTSISDLKVACVIDITKGTKLLGRAVKAGVEIAMDEAAKNGRKVPQVVFVDDEYTPSKTRKEMDKLVKEGVTTILTPEGSPTLQSYLDLVKSGTVSVFFPITGTPIAREKDLTSIINFRPSYKTEGEILTLYAINTLGSKKGYILYQKDAYGEGLLQGAQDVLKEKNIANWIADPYERNEVKFNEQVKRMLEADPDAILFFSTTFAAQEFIRQAGVEKLLARKFLGSSDFGEDQFVTFIKDKGLKLVYLNVVPHPTKSELPIVKNFRDAAAQRNVSLDTFSLEGYISASLFLYGLEKVSPPITRQKLMKELEQINDLDYKGLLLNFDPNNRTLSHFFWLYDGKEKWKKISAKSPLSKSGEQEQ